MARLPAALAPRGLRGVPAWRFLVTTSRHGETGSPSERDRDARVEDGFPVSTGREVVTRSRPADTPRNVRGASAAGKHRRLGVNSKKRGRRLIPGIGAGSVSRQIGDRHDGDSEVRESSSRMWTSGRKPDSVLRAGRNSPPAVAATRRGSPRAPSRLHERRVSRSGAIPGPTVTVRMKEKRDSVGCCIPPWRAAAAAFSRALILETTHSREP